MFCNCSNGRSCSKCKGVKLNQFPAVNTIASGNQFVLAGNKLISYEALLNDIQASISIPPINRVYVSAGTYDMTGNEDVIWCTGDVTVNLPLTINGNRVAYFNSDGGTVSFVAQVGETHTIANITTGQSAPIAANANAKEWREL